MNYKIFYPGVKQASNAPIDRHNLIEWLIEHPLWGDDDGFDNCVDIDFLPYVNPETGNVDSDPRKNTVMAIRVEAGAENTHDRRFDFWAPTVENVLIELALRVRFFYDERGDELSNSPQPCQLACKKYDNNLCVKCGFVKDWWNYWSR